MTVAVGVMVDVSVIEHVGVTVNDRVNVSVTVTVSVTEAVSMLVAVSVMLGERNIEGVAVNVGEKTGVYVSGIGDTGSLFFTHAENSTDTSNRRISVVTAILLIRVFMFHLTEQTHICFGHFLMVRGEFK